MLIAGSISGIQNYLFDVAQEGGGQSRRLRARSFFMQLLTEVACLRVLQAVGWNKDLIIFSGAGKFMLQGESNDTEKRGKILAVERDINRWLLTEIGGGIRFSIAVSDSTDDARQQHKNMGISLDKKKRQAWKSVAITKDGWRTEQLILPPLDTPCSLCRKHKAEFKDRDDNVTREVCRRCHDDRELGRKLPSVKWATLSEQNISESYNIGGWHVSLHKEEPKANDGNFILSLDGKQNGFEMNPQAISRRLLRHIPTNEKTNEPIEFLELAEKATGDKLLGVLKMDADKVGLHIEKLLQNKSDFISLKNFSKEFDDFFAAHLNRKIKEDRWSSIYTIFSGGDDLLLVGPWDVLFDFAFEVRHDFFNQFKTRLTLSGGFTLIKPKLPIRFAAEHAEKLLDVAKETHLQDEEEGRDQFAAFGQIWKWKHHEKIISTAKQLFMWTNAGLMQRGWLHSLLRLAELRLNEEAKNEAKLATARLAYTIARNYPRANHYDPEKAALRRWANQLMNDFDELRNIETRYLPAIVRYALTATRSGRSE